MDVIKRDQSERWETREDQESRQRKRGVWLVIWPAAERAMETTERSRRATQ